MTGGFSGGLVNIRQESEDYWDEWDALRASHGIAENLLSYCFVLAYQLEVSNE